MNELDLSTLSHEEVIAIAQEAIEQKQQFEDSYKQIKSSTSRGTQLILDLHDYTLNHNGDLDKLAEIEEYNPDLAKLIQEKNYWGKSSEELRPKVTPKLQSQIDEVLEQLPEDQRAKFVTEFDELTDGKKITDENLSKFVKATMAVIQENVDESIKDDLKIWSMGSEGKKTSSKKEEADAWTKKQMDIAQSFDNL